jgi:hypothetical protein
MRLPLIAQAHLSPEQRPIYEDMRGRYREKLGALLGPGRGASPSL